MCGGERGGWHGSGSGVDGNKDINPVYRCIKINKVYYGRSKCKMHIMIRAPAT